MVQYPTITFGEARYGIRYSAGFGISLGEVRRISVPEIVLVCHRINRYCRRLWTQVSIISSRRLSCLPCACWWHPLLLPAFPRTSPDRSLRLCRASTPCRTSTSARLRPSRSPSSTVSLCAALRPFIALVECLAIAPRT